MVNANKNGKGPHLPSFVHDRRFNDLLREGVSLGRASKPWTPVLNHVPLVQWPDFISAMGTFDILRLKLLK